MSLANSLRRLTSLTLLVGPGLIAVSIAHTVRADDDAQALGKQIYADRCAQCHGANGEGNPDEYPEPLIGDRALSELTGVISETMPEDDPKSTVGADADAVASYIYDAFYSPAAQASRSPARVSLSRLTVREYENTVADLIHPFLSGSTTGSDERGLSAEYFESKSPQRDKRKIERIDPVIDLALGENSPDPEQIKPDEFSMKWQGSLTAPETGNYEVVLQTENGARLWLNEMREEFPLIDAWVRSGDQTEYRATIRLLGGRRYPLKVDYYKHKLKTASIRLLWRPPHGVEELIPARVFSPQPVRSTFVLSTTFPPDDASYGYVRGDNVSREWFSAASRAGLETAAWISMRADDLARTKSDAADRNDKLLGFCLQFAESAYRRPMTNEQRGAVEAAFQSAGNDPKLGVKRAVLLSLTSPLFLYREPFGLRDDYDRAARLSFALWDSIPDDELLAAAANNQLTTREQLREQAVRMKNDPRAAAKLKAFFRDWLQMDHFADIARNETLFPGFDATTLADQRVSLELLIDDVLASDDTGYADLMTSRHVWLNERLAKLYGVDLQEGPGFQRIELEPEVRCGVLGHPYLLTGFSYYSTSSPIHRGVFIARNILGRALRPPPEAVTPIPPELHSDLTTRERTAMQTAPANCMTCHALINPLGFGLENYDAIGRYRTEEAAKPVDSSGAYRDTSGETVEFQGLPALAEFIASNDEAHSAFVARLFHFSVHQPLNSCGPEAVDRLQQNFRDQGLKISSLFVETGVEAAMLQPADDAIATTSAPGTP